MLPRGLPMKAVPGNALQLPGCAATAHLQPSRVNSFTPIVPGGEVSRNRPLRPDSHRASASVNWTSIPTWKTDNKLEFVPWKGLASDTESNGAYSKKFVVGKCLVSLSNFERGGHKSPIEVVLSVPLDRDQAYAFCARLNEEERTRENRD